MFPQYFILFHKTFNQWKQQGLFLLQSPRNRVSLFVCIITDVFLKHSHTHGIGYIYMFLDPNKWSTSHELSFIRSIYYIVDIRVVTYEVVSLEML
jgi:hypothetical protein